MLLFKIGTASEITVTFHSQGCLSGFIQKYICICILYKYICILYSILYMNV